MENAKNLVDALGNYIKGDEVERSKVGVRLLRRVMEEKALEMIKRKYALQGYTHIEALCNELAEYGESVIRGKVKSIEPMRKNNEEKSIPNNKRDKEKTS